MRATRHYALWCTKCPTRIKVETESDDDDYLGEIAALARVKPPTRGDDGLEAGDLCPLCGALLAMTEDLYVLERVIPRTWQPEDEPRLHAKALEVLRTREQEKEPKA